MIASDIIRFISIAAAILFIICILLLLPDIMVALAGQTKKYHRAIFACNCKLKFVPRSASAYANRGWAFLQLKEYQHTISDSTQAIALNPKLAAAYNNRGYAYLRTKEYQRALQDFDRALALKPLMRQASINRIHAYYTIGEYQRALAECDRLIQAGSAQQRQYTYFSRGTIYLHQRKYQQALEDLDQAIILNPDNAVAYNNRGCAYYYLKEYQRACADCDKAIALKPEYGIFYGIRAMVYLGLSQLEQAQSDLQKACALDPGFIAHGWNNEYLKMCLHGAHLETAQRLEALAQTDPTTAILFAPQDYFVPICLGVAHWLRGDFEQALRELEQAMLLDTYNEDAYFWAGMACASLGRDDEAHKALQKALEFGLLPIFLAPLRWLEPQRPDFYTRYALPLLNGATAFKENSA